LDVERWALLIESMLTAIIVAAGSSQRLGVDKLMAEIAGKPVIFHTVEAFQKTKSVGHIVVVTRADRIGEFKSALGSLTKIRVIIAGGEHRHNSVEAGLRQLGGATDYVSVHDGARPLIRPEEIEKVYQEARVHGAAALAEPVRDTLKRADDHLVVQESVDRHQVYAMQTPQIFERKLLEQAYETVSRNGERVTDEVSAVELLGRSVVLVPNPEVNFKITYERDLRLAEAVLVQRQANV
jgi:2-C-methyl-D-erythritol 4-phosphate cytidylyltransferase